MRAGPTAPIDTDLLLVGGGHSHLAVLRYFAMRPRPGLRITLISPDAQTAYSGMLPGLVAGHYDFDAAHIDLTRLCGFAGARFIQARVAGLDLARQAVLLDDRPPVPFDLLSLNVGSTPAVDKIPGAAAHAIAVKPVGRFLERWRDIEASGGPLRVGIVGAGAGGVEIAFALRHRLAARRPLQLEIFDGAATILPGHHPAVRHRIAARLDGAGIERKLGDPVRRVERGALILESGARHALDQVLWTTQAAAPGWLVGCGLALDEKGFVLVEDTLQSPSHASVFAAGDVATMANHVRPKSGVFAVRQGRPLARNIALVLQGRAPRPYRPQKRFLSLLSTGDKVAVASRGSLAFEGALLWRWKDWIDRRFMRRYNDLPVAQGAAGEPPPRCAGCGAKVGDRVLRSALARLSAVAPGDGIGIALDAPDDAAVMTPPAGQVLVQSVDFFPALVGDPFLFGQITANHCLGDLHAMGAKPWTALATAVVPPDAPAKVEDTLYQLLAGAGQVLAAAGAVLVGGHSGEGDATALGLTVNGLAMPDKLLRKGGARPGDRLILTKALGSGVLFAGEMRGLSRGRWIEAAIATMLRSSQDAAATLQAPDGHAHAHAGAHAMTDVTGFGLAGHLAEMLVASDCDAVIDAGQLPRLEGSAELFSAGVESSLAPTNRQRLAGLCEALGDLDVVTAGLLCDPQTAGGLLAAVPADSAAEIVRKLRDQGDRSSCVIGHIEARAGPDPQIRF